MIDETKSRNYKTGHSLTPLADQQIAIMSHESSKYNLGETTPLRREAKLIELPKTKQGKTSIMKLNS